MSLAWNPDEANVLLTAGSDKRVSIAGARVVVVVVKRGKRERGGG